MTSLPRYQVASTVRQICLILNISSDQILRRAGLAADCLSNDRKGVSGNELFSIWRAIEAEYPADDLALKLAIPFARVSFTPAVFAFSCSETVETGLHRLALFKPLIAPVHMEVSDVETGLDIAFLSADSNDRMPSTLALFELVFFVELLRTFTAVHVKPLVANGPQLNDEVANYLGCRFDLAEDPSLSLSRSDIILPLISHNQELWKTFEPELRRRLAGQLAEQSLGERVKNVLLEALPAGQTTVEDIAGKLNMSRRSLQRRLTDEQTTFQTILDRTRSDLAKHYLETTDLSLIEISYLIGYRDSTSFFRAFQGWTGTTPMEYRAKRSSK